MNNNPQDAWENLFDQMPLDTAPPDEARAKAKDRALAALDDANRVSTADKGPRADGFRTIGQVLMRYKAPYWTAAMIAVGFFVWFGKGGSPAFAVENLVKNIVNCRTARYDRENIINGKSISIEKELYRAPGSYRTESDAHIMIHEGAKFLTLYPDSKTAQKISGGELEGPKAPVGGNIFETMRNALKDENTEVVEIGRKLIGGKEAVGFRFVTGDFADSSSDAGLEYVIWAGFETQFPVEIEISVDYPDPRIKNVTMILKNYEFNVELDDALFSLDVPKDYKLVSSKEIDFRAGESEEVFIEGLKKYVDAVGAFPTTLHGPGAPAAVMMGLIPAITNGVQNEDGENVAEDVILKVLPFPMKMSQNSEADAHYSAKGAKPGDATRPVYWYKPDGKDTYRVIYADFTVKDSAEAPASGSEF